MAEPSLSFGALLRHLRAEAQLTQEELARAASLSPRSVSDLERGINRTARKDTALLLADAFGLRDHVGAVFVAAARGRAPATDVLAARSGRATAAYVAAARALPRDIACFTGRQAELEQLTGTLTAGAGGGVIGIHAIGGMAGVGKTTFAVHGAHRLASSFPDGQFFLPLHAHTAGQRPVDPADALASLLLTAGMLAARIPAGLEARAACWRDQVAGKRILLLLDDATGHEQVRPLLPGGDDSLVLITSRRRLTALADSAKLISLDCLPPGEAVALLTSLAARPATDAADPAVAEVARLCGYLPLAIGMAGAQLRHHPARTADSLAAQLAAAHDRLSFMRAENLTVSAAFDLSYQNLSADQQRLFRCLGLIPGADLDGYAAAALAGVSLDQASRLLDDLYDEYLLSEPAAGRYELHDLVREHARMLAAADDPTESDAAVGRLLEYYLHAAVAAGQHFDNWAGANRCAPLGDPPAEIPDLSASAAAAAWLIAERQNLHAAVDFAADRGYFRHAAQIPAAMRGFLSGCGSWDQSAALHKTALVAARRSADKRSQAHALSELGVLGWLTGEYAAAVDSLAPAAALYEDVGDLPDQAYVLTVLGMLQRLTGDIPSAMATYRNAISLTRRAGDRIAEAGALGSLGEAQQIIGDFSAATRSQQRALKLAREARNSLAEAMVLNDFGVLKQVTADYAGAAASQELALTLFRSLDYSLGQAFASNDLGEVQRETGDYLAAEASHQQAFAIFCELGNRLGQAEALNRLGELSSLVSATGQARDRHSRALAMARELGVPFEEARALAGLGHAYLLDGNRDQAARYLARALSIYERIGAHAAQRVQDLIRDNSLAATTPQP